MNTLASLITDKGFFFEGTNGKTVLLAHGLTGAPNEMKFIGKQLHKQGYTVACPMLAGHGATEAELLKSGWRDWYASLEQTMLALKETSPQLYTAGICVGGMLGLNLAYHHPEIIVGVVIYSATLTYDGWNIPKTRFFSPLIPYVGKLPLFRERSFVEEAPFGIKDDRLRDRIMKSDLLEHCLPSFPFPSLAEMYRLSGVMKKRFASIATPTLLLHARNDDVSSLKNSEYLAKKLGGHTELGVLEDCYHMIHIDRERHKVAQMTGDFFAREVAYA